MTIAWPKHGDHVLVRGVVRQVGHPASRLNGELVVDFTLDHFVPVELADIVKIEHAAFQVGDRVIAKSFPGVILCLWPDGELAWVKPDSGTKEPWTVAVRDMVREPPAPPSAEVVELHGAAQRPCDTEAAV